MKITLKLPEIGAGTVCLACISFLTIIGIAAGGWSTFLLYLFGVSILAAVFGAMISGVIWITNHL